MTDQTPEACARIERIAELVYNTWKHQEGWVPWAKGGNSTQQDHARRVARCAVDLERADDDAALTPRERADLFLEEELRAAMADTQELQRRLLCMALSRSPTIEGAAGMRLSAAKVHRAAEHLAARAAR